jgi:hypothetical protein
MVIGMDAVSHFEPLPAHPLGLGDKSGGFFCAKILNSF